ncbi:hypothetical protein HPS41_05415 [Glaesserella parasuis ST4-1]|nr:hypothetical protein HPS41_05415 [Glaesserella parasuis ST4-1]
MCNQSKFLLDLIYSQGKMFYDTYDKNIVEYYLISYVFLFSGFGKMGSFLFMFQKEGLKPCTIDIM